MANATPPIPYHVEVANVHEVALLGTADLAFWTERLRGESLTPTNVDGRAQILIVAADMKYMGIRARELSFSVGVGDLGENGRSEGAFLVQAFNAVRFFAWVERTFFRTPYDYAEVSVSWGPPCSLRVRKGDAFAFRAAMADDKRPPIREGDHGWEGTIYLPGCPPDRPEQGRVFFGKLCGHSRSHSFLPDVDELVLRPSAKAPVIQWLLDSGYAAVEWSIRANATHGKSKTVTRDSL